MKQLSEPNFRACFFLFGLWILTFNRCTAVTALSIQNKIHWFYNCFWASVFEDLVNSQFKGLVNLRQLIISSSCTAIDICNIIILDQHKNRNKQKLVVNDSTYLGRNLVLEYLIV